MTVLCLAGASTRRRRLLSLVVAALAITVVSDPAIAAEPAVPPVRYQPPVDGVVIDPFRPPPHPYGPGNRGLEYATAALEPVRAAADGTVVFAGDVGGARHVTVLHADGLRTSYSFLAAVTVTVGARVRRGDVLGISQGVVHVGVRDPGGVYLDPATLFGSARRARLVPGGDDGTDVGSERSPLRQVVAERRGPLEEHLAGAPGGEGGERLGIDTRTELMGTLLGEVSAVTHRRRMAAGVRRWAGERARCTPATSTVPSVVGRRRLVLTGDPGPRGTAAVAHLDWPALGYRPEDVTLITYDPSGLGSAREADLRAAASELVGELERLSAAEPEVPIDVVAHAHGGLVARLAVVRTARRDGRPSALRTLVTIGSPHQGSHVGAALALRPTGAVSRDQGSSAPSGAHVVVDGRSAGGLAPTSPLISELRSAPASREVRMLSIAGRGDLTVPSARTAIDGAGHTVVPVGGADVHLRLPAEAEVTREIALALSGAAPTCRALADIVADHLVSASVSRAHALRGLRWIRTGRP
jgi:hypothetical protein